jgi:hypothetical protein
MTARHLRPWKTTTNKTTTNPAPVAFTRGAPRFVDLFVDTKNGHFQDPISVQTFPVVKVITVGMLACLSLPSTVYQILYRTCSGPIPPTAARNNFIKLIVLLLFNVKWITWYLFRVHLYKDPGIGNPAYPFQYVPYCFYSQSYFFKHQHCCWVIWRGERLALMTFDICIIFLFFFKTLLYIYSSISTISSNINSKHIFIFLFSMRHDIEFQWCETVKKYIVDNCFRFNRITIQINIFNSHYVIKNVKGFTILNICFYYRIKWFVNIFNMLILVSWYALAFWS